MGVMSASLSSEETLGEIERILRDARSRIEALHEEQNKIFDEYRAHLTELRIANIAQQIHATKT